MYLASGEKKPIANPILKQLHHRTGTREAQRGAYPVDGDNTSLAASFSQRSSEAVSTWVTKVQRPNARAA